MPDTNILFGAAAAAGLATTPLTASTALAEATGSGEAVIYEVGSAATINLTAPNSTVGGVATFVASNHGAGAKLLVSDSAAGAWDVSEIGSPASMPLAYGRINASVALANTTYTDALPGVLIPFTNIIYSSGVTFAGTTGIIPAKAGRYRASWLMMNGSEEFLNDGYFHVVQNGVSIGQVLYNLMEAAGVNQCAGFIDVNVAAGQAVSLHFRTSQGNPGDALSWDAGSYFQLDQLPSTESVQAGTIVPTPLHVVSISTITPDVNSVAAVLTESGVGGYYVPNLTDPMLTKYDPNAMVVGNKVVIQQAGRYRLAGGVRAALASPEPGIRVNGIYVATGDSAGAGEIQSYECVRNLVVGDIVDFTVSASASTSTANGFYLTVEQLASSTVVDPGAVPLATAADINSGTTANYINAKQLRTYADDAWMLLRR